MKIREILKKQGRSFSFEFFPPKDEPGEKNLFETIGKLEHLGPAFVSVTYGAGGGTSKNTGNVVVRIENETSLVPMPHLTCVDQSNEELENILEDYKKSGIENVLALRGDPPKGVEGFVAPKRGFCHAKDLVELCLSVGGYSIGVAVYPEGYIESPSLEMDMNYTKQKIDAGADFAITQMFFDNRFFYDFMERAEKANIRIPIIPGIMPISDLKGILKFSRQCGAALPDWIVKRYEAMGPSKEEAGKIGIELATEQCEDLLNHGVRHLHFYTLNHAETVTQIVNNLGLRVSNK
jgi:methylenetetrahydrofolate reductase (NADPH)